MIERGEMGGGIAWRTRWSAELPCRCELEVCPAPHATERKITRTDREGNVTATAEICWCFCHRCRRPGCEERQVSREYGLCGPHNAERIAALVARKKRKP